MEDNVSEHLDRLGRQLDAIELAIAAAHAEPDPDRRAHIFAVADRATTAARNEYNDAVDADKRRAALRIIKGGAVAAAATSGAEWVRTAWRNHHQAAGASALVAAASLAAVVVYAGIDNTGDPVPSAAPPTVTSAPAGLWPSLPPIGSTTPSPTPPSATSPTGASTPVPASGHATSPEGPISAVSAPSSTAATPQPTSRPSPTGPATASPGPTETATAGPPPESPEDGVCLGLRLRPILDAGTCAALAGAS
jgi:hypothetical protein